jgi:SAM-dependent methyltransferase
VVVLDVGIFEHVHERAEFACERDRDLIDLLYRKPLDQGFRWLGDVGKLRVVEIGCGNGEVAVTLALHGARVLGIDKDLAVLASARRLAAQFRVAHRCVFLAGRSEELPLKTGCADLLISRSTLQYVDRRRVSSEVARILRPTGRIMLIENLPCNPWIRVFRLLRKLRAKNATDVDYVGSLRGYLTWSEIDTLGSASPDLRQRSYYLFRMGSLWFRLRYPNWWLCRIVDRWIQTLDTALLKWLPPLCRWAWFILIVGYRPAREAGDMHLRIPANWKEQ